MTELSEALDLSDLEPLERLHAEAELRGWEPDSGRNARPNCWVSVNDPRAHFVVQPPSEVAVFVVNAHLPDDSLRVSIGDPAGAGRALAILRAFLGWDEGVSDA